MFKAKEAFSKLNGKIFTVRELEDELASIRVEHRGQLPAEIGVRELFDLLHIHNWLVELKNGKLLVTL